MSSSLAIPKTQNWKNLPLKSSVIDFWTDRMNGYQVINRHPRGGVDSGLAKS